MNSQWKAKSGPPEGRQVAGSARRPGAGGPGLRRLRAAVNRWALVLVVGWLAVGSAAAQSVQFAFKFGSPGSGDGQFVYPQGVTVAPGGGIIVVDHYNHRIQVFR